MSADIRRGISLEDDFWRSLIDIAASKRLSIRDLVSKIDSERKHGNLSSAVRIFVLNDYKQRCLYLSGLAGSEYEQSRAGMPTEGAAMGASSDGCD